MTAYVEPAYDDTTCSCGRKLSDTVIPMTWDDHGFCGLRCAVSCLGGFHLQGQPALELAEYGGRLGGPGFESDIVRDWLKAARDNAPAMLSRISGDADIGPQHAGSWCWRLWSGGICHAMRLTPKP